MSQPVIITRHVAKHGSKIDLRFGSRLLLYVRFWKFTSWP